MAHDTSEVTAQRMSAAFNAVQDVVQAIEERQLQLELTPIGRQWLEDAQAMRELMDSGG
jgi:predicted transcriptional regulator